MTWNPYLSVAAIVRPSAQIGLLTQVPSLSVAVVTAPAAWANLVSTSGDLNGGFPYFDVPAGWPTPTLPEP